jgi:uncharacterized protein with ParB-like and HNH nuclease domain
MSVNIDCRSITLGKLLTSDDCCYKVPMFQRDYSWTKIEVNQLWTDIINTIKEKRNEHFMGAVVVNNSKKPELLIDGQQRLATISLLMCVIRDVAKEEKQERLSVLISDKYLGSTNIRTYEPEPKLILNEINNQIYKENILEYKGFDFLKKKAKNQNLEKSNKLLINAYLQLYQNVKQHISKEGILAEYLVEIIECIRDKLVIILISVADEANAYLIFETLNDRGLDLSLSDLLKNYIFSKADTKLQEIQKKWEAINRSVGRFEVTKFIRHYWLSKYDVIREKDLYHAIRDKFKSQPTVIAFVSSLTESAEIYGALEDPQHSFWSLNDVIFRSDIAALKLFKVSLCYSLLLAAKESLEEDVFSKVLRMMVIISFRYNVVCSSKPTPLESAYSKTAKYIRKHKPKTAKSIFEQLAEFYPNDKVFSEHFEVMTVNSSQLARYILGAINNHYMNNKELITNPSGAEVNLEHILPQKPGNQWLELLPGIDVDTYIDRLGNMTLLDSIPNRKLGNALFKDKCSQAYAHSKLKITTELLKYQTWGVQQINERQKNMAKIATQIWRLDY